jgi:hypothetical protein
MDASLLERYLQRQRQHHQHFVRNVFVIIVALNVLFVLGFWLLYGLMLSGDDGTHFQSMDGESLTQSAAIDGLYLSVTTQTTVGSARVVPRSSAAVLVVSLQSMSTLALFLGAVLVFIAVASG